MSFTIKFYQDTRAHSCSYLPDRLAQNIYPDPNHPMTIRIYDQLIQHGFRRSGNHVYRPYCTDCLSCVPVRINVDKFQPSRSQRRCLKRNAELTMVEKPAQFNPEHFQLYCRYLKHRHAGGGMDNPTEDSFTHFLTSYWCDTQFLEFRDKGKLRAVAVTDFVEHGLSAFYTFFDPDYQQAGLGTFAILKQLELAKSLQLNALYLGYWIEECPKMNYKQSFSALEAYQNQQWQVLKS